MPCLPIQNSAHQRAQRAIAVANDDRTTFTERNLALFELDSFAQGVTARRQKKPDKVCSLMPDVLRAIERLTQEPKNIFGSPQPQDARGAPGRERTATENTQVSTAISSTLAHSQQGSWPLAPLQFGTCDPSPPSGLTPAPRVPRTRIKTAPNASASLALSPRVASLHARNDAPGRQFVDSLVPPTASYPLQRTGSLSDFLRRSSYDLSSLGGPSAHSAHRRDVDVHRYLAFGPLSIAQSSTTQLSSSHTDNPLRSETASMSDAGETWLSHLVACYGDDPVDRMPRASSRRMTRLNSIDVSVDGRSDSSRGNLYAESYRSSDHRQEISRSSTPFDLRPAMYQRSYSADTFGPRI